MNKYIESELMKRRGIEKAGGEKIGTFERKKLHEILDPKSLYHLPEVQGVIIIDDVIMSHYSEVYAKVKSS